MHKDMQRQNADQKDVRSHIDIIYLDFWEIQEILTPTQVNTSEDPHRIKVHNWNNEYTMLSRVQLICHLQNEQNYQQNQQQWQLPLLLRI